MGFLLSRAFHGAGGRLTVILRMYTPQIDGSIWEPQNALGPADDLKKTNKKGTLRRIPLVQNW